MHLPMPDEGGDFKPAPAGSHPAICYRVIDLGTQRKVFNGEESFKRQVRIWWELHGEDCLNDDGKPLIYSEPYTLSAHEKAALRKHLEAWRGKQFTQAELAEFDMKSLLGRPCLLNLVHKESNGNVYCNLSSVMKLPKGMSVGAQVNPSVYFSLEPDRFDRAVLNSLPDWLQDKIKKSPEFKKASQVGKQNEPQPAETDDEIPF